MWKVACCEVQGGGHRNAHVPCQDKTFAVSLAGSDVIALADGAGSAKLSHYGAERVACCVATYIAEHFNDCFGCETGQKVKQRLVELIESELRQEAENRGCEIRDLASTLLLAAVNGEHFILVHVGDGVIGILDGETLKVASYPENGEFSNETIFVTSRDVTHAMRIYRGTLNDKCAFVLMSDGTAQSLYHRQTQTLAPVIVKLMHRVCLIDRDVLQNQLKTALDTVVAQNTRDDCSIAILARYSPILCPLENLTFQEKCNLFQIEISHHRTRWRRKVSRYETILEILREPQTYEQIASRIHLKPCYTKRHMEKLVALGLLCCKGYKYARAMK